MRRSAAELRESKEGVRRGVRKAFTGSTCSPWLVQSISNCRAKRGRARKNWPKMVVVCHRLVHSPEQVKEVFLGNMATADAMSRGFKNEERGFMKRFMSNLRPCGTVKFWWRLLVEGL